MIETTIHFILSLIELFVKFLGNIKINLFGYSFSFYSFILASVIILVFVSGIIAITRRAGSSYVSAVDKSAHYKSDKEKQAELNSRYKKKVK